MRLLQIGVIACFLLSGVTGLLYETLWSRHLSALIGSSAYAHTAVLATFMAGLGLGNALLGPLADRVKSPLALYAWLEVGLGLWALIFPGILALAGSAYLSLGAWLTPESAWILPLKITLGALALLPPTVMMGGTLPALGRWLVERAEDIGHRVGMLYFLNTAGAVLGCVLGGFVVVEAWGLDLSMQITAGVNLGIGAGLLWLDRARAGAALEEEPEPPTESEAFHHRNYEAPQVRAAKWGIGIAGALSMVYELVWIRMVGVVFGSSSQSFSVMLISFISGIALGGAVASWLLRKDRDAFRLLGWCELGVALSVLALVPLYEHFPYWFASLRDLLARTEAGFTWMQCLQVAMLCALMGVPTTLMGLALPLASRVISRGTGTVGEDVGSAFAANTLGTLLGAAATGLVFLPWLGMQGTLYLGIFSSAVLGCGLLWLVEDKRRWIGASSLVAVAVVSVCGLSWRWDPILLTAGFFRSKSAPTSFQAMKDQYKHHKLLFSEDGADTTVTVLELNQEVFLKVNAKTDASTLRDDMVTQVISGHLPMLLHPTGAREVMVIGLGSGVTAGAVLQHPETRVQMVELSEAVVEGAKFFNHVNHKVLEHPRAKLHIGDAKDYLLLDKESRYDVIISEPSNPWISGVANLFSTDFFETVRGKLNKDGIYVQWLQLYAFHDEAFMRTLQTMREAFPSVSVWRFTRNDCLLVASESPLRVTPEAIAERLEIPEVARDLGPEGPLEIRTPLELAVHQVWSDASEPFYEVPGLPLNSDEHPYLEFEAPRAMFQRLSPAVLNEKDERFSPERRNALLFGRFSAQKDAFSLEEVRRFARALQRAGQEKAAEKLFVSAFSRMNRGELLQSMRAGFEDAEPFWGAEQVLNAESPEADACLYFSGRMTQLLLSSRSAFFDPSGRLLLDLLRKCVATHPKDQARLWLNRASYFYGLNLFEEAYESSTKARQSLRDEDGKALHMDVLLVQGRSAVGSRKLREARDIYEAILRKDPKNKEARALLGR